MIVEIIPCLQDNYSYLIIDENNNACLVDPGESGPIIDYIENNNINLKFILNTHHHYDHIISQLKKYLNQQISFLYQDLYYLLMKHFDHLELMI